MLSRKTFNRITDLRKEILSLKKSVVVATEAASKAEAELEDAKSKLTLTLVDEEGFYKGITRSEKKALLVRAIDEIEALFLFLYKSFSSVLAEPLRDTDGSLHLPPEADEMAIDNEDAPTTDLDNEGGGSQKSHDNGGRSKNGYNVGEKEQWCLTTLGYVKAFTRQYASEIWPLVEKLDAEV
ncbi:Nuclear cap-binding protein subunit [Sesamum alatum]|uniref:Nuclear cap-binding protein subunit n=1 Tax=Sesamum alatum TaxID=300844 RepID=A0AAE1YZI6_9LAMI|nr:Nuclear cap-binding protein subunit [Sesamum alatum]